VKGEIVRKILSIFVFILVFATNSWAASNVTLAWDPTPSGVVGVRIYQSAAAGTYQYGSSSAVATIAAGTTQATLSNVPDGTYYWVATAYDAAGNESGPSNEVSATFDTTAPAAPGTLRIEVVVKVTSP
jgi:hypothetical protein